MLIERDVELDIEIWPTCIVLPAGFRVALTIGGKDTTIHTGLDTPSHVLLPIIPS